MLKIGNEKITRYHYWKKLTPSYAKLYYVDIIETNHGGNSVDMFEAWLVPWDRGLSTLMFGCPKEQSNGDIIDYEKFMEMVEANVDDYIGMENGW